MRWEFRGDVRTEDINWGAVSVKVLLKATRWYDITGGREVQAGDRLSKSFSFGDAGERGTRD